MLKTEDIQENVSNLTDPWGLPALGKYGFFEGFLYRVDIPMAIKQDGVHVSLKNPMGWGWDHVTIEKQQVPKKVSKFKVGDIVKSVHGHSKLVVVKVNEDYVTTVYVNKNDKDSTIIQTRKEDKFVFWEPEPEPEKTIQEEVSERIKIGKSYTHIYEPEVFGKAVKITKKGNVVLRTSDSMVKLKSDLLKKSEPSYYWGDFILLSDYFNDEENKIRTVKINKDFIECPFFKDSIYLFNGNLYIFISEHSHTGKHFSHMTCMSDVILCDSLILTEAAS